MRAVPDHRTADDVWAEMDCPERVFLVDDWVFAPADEKHEHMYRMDMILDTFRCPTESREVG